MRVLNGGKSSDSSFKRDSAAVLDVTQVRCGEARPTEEEKRGVGVFVASRRVTQGVPRLPPSWPRTRVFSWSWGGAVATEG